MKRRMLFLALAGATMFVLTVAPASAHINDAIPSNRGTEQAQDRQGGAPFQGFVGPVEEFVGEEIYVQAHSGMECGALRSPNMGALGPEELGGSGFDDRFVCPSAERVR